MTNFLLKFFRLISLAIVLIVLMICYVQLPDSVAIQHNDVGRPVGFMDKQNFFYMASAVIVGLFLLFGLLRGQFEKVDFKGLNSKSVWANQGNKLNNLLMGWTDAFITAINLYLVFTLLGLKSVNQAVNQNLDRDYGWFLMLGAVLLMIFIFFVPLRILFTKPSTEEE